MLFNLRTAALATTSVTSVISLMAMPTPAWAQQGNCTYGQPISITLTNPRGENLTNQVAVERAIGDSQVQALLRNAPAQCRAFVVTESLRISGLAPSAQLAPSVQVRIAIPTGFTAAPAETVAPQLRDAPANAGATRPGAQIDTILGNHESRITAIENRLAGGNIDADTARSLRAELATLRSRRPTSVTRTVTINRGPNPADERRWNQAAAASRRNTGLLDQLFGHKGPNGEEVQGIIPSLQGGLDRVSDKLFGNDGTSDVIANHESRITTTEGKLASWWAPQWWWFLVALVAFLAWRFFRKESATKDDLTTKADATTVADQSKRIDDLDARLTDTEQQVGKKIVALAPDLAATVAGMKEGEELTTTVVVESVAHEVGLRKGAGDDVFIVSGVKGHVASNVVKAYNLTRTLRNAAWSDRLNVKASV